MKTGLMSDFVNDTQNTSSVMGADIKQTSSNSQEKTGGDKGTVKIEASTSIQGFVLQDPDLTLKRKDKQQQERSKSDHQSKLRSTSGEK